MASVDVLDRASPPLLLAVGLERTVEQTLFRLSQHTQAPYLALSRAFAERLADLAPRDRPRRAARLFHDLMRPTRGSLTILDRTAILFAVDLMLNPLQLLIETSRIHGPIVAAWCGNWDGTILTYAVPEHPEHQRYVHPVVLVIPVV